MYVAPEYQYPVYVEIIPPTYPIEEEYDSMMRKVGMEYLQPVQEAAKQAGVPFSSIVLFSDSAGSAIADAAKEENRRPDFHGVAWPFRTRTAAVGE